MRIKAALVLGSLLLFAAACGGEDGGGVASADDATASASEENAGGGPENDLEEALAYSECMRENGIAEFPDPEQNDEGGIMLGLPEGIDPESEEFKAAEEACEEFMPGPGEGEQIDPEALEEMREFSQCMRENGIENYPDPNAEGGIKLDPETLGVDPLGPEMRAAEEACAGGPGAPGGPGGGTDEGEDA